VLFSAIPFFVLMGVLGVGGYFAVTRGEHRRPIMIAGVVGILGCLAMISSVSSKSGFASRVHIGW